jgi:hypothetical protein
MNKINLITNIAAAAISALLFSCGGDNSTDELSLVDTTENLMNENLEDLFDSPEFDYQLPSPLQVASIFKNSGLAYNTGATSDPETEELYTDQMKQMLNFGIYSADMAYCVLNEQSNEARKYLEVITNLADRIEMEAVFENKDLMDRFDKNIGDKDSIEILMLDIHERTEIYMDENDMQHQQAIHFAGAWTEGMYLGVYDFEHSSDKEDVGAKIAEQMSILQNIIKGLNDPKNAGMDLAWLISDMTKIQETFDSFQTVIDYFNDPSADELYLDKKEYDTLGALIKELRSKIIMP